ncbi:hypothetical protein [Myxococcus sp. Y35]|uniref:hypothetical protein n=1 Tax=Pseudomyxococcus flavus TaxID=3115648 RepID=UPI003CF37B77
MSVCIERMRATLCTDCGAIQLGADVTDDGQFAPHGATAAGLSVRAAYPGPWPTCRHGYGWRADCRGRPVPPMCCAHPPCALTPPSTNTPSDPHEEP